MKVLIATHPDLKPNLKRKGVECDVLRALRRLGHQVDCVGFGEDGTEFDRAVKDFRPDLVFNLLEEFQSEAVYDFHLATRLESLGIPFTGCNPRGLVLSRNKFAACGVAAAMGLAVPRSRLVRAGVTRVPLGLDYPIFAKFNREHSSLGIRENNRAPTAGRLKKVLVRLARDYGLEVLLQDYVGGIEVSLSLWGNAKVEAFAPRRLYMRGESQIATEKVKFNLQYQKARGLRRGSFLGTLPLTLCREFYRALDLNGYARFDFRVNSAGVAFLIDVNANPSLAKDEDFALSARAAGLTYEDVIARVIELALAYQPTR